MSAVAPEVDRPPAGPLVDWLIGNKLLRGPFLFVDYWVSVLALEGRVSESHVRDGLIDPALFRIGLDRPDLEVPRLRFYILFFLIGPLLLLFRTFRRLGRYRLRFRRAVGESVLSALERYRLELHPTGAGRVSVARGDRAMAEDVLDPRLISGFSSLFHAAYTAGLLDEALRLWVPVFCPAVALILYAVYRDVATAFVGALPVLAGRYLISAFGPPNAPGWGPFLLAMLALLALLLAADWFFLPRPVPPVLMLYSKDEPARAYERPGDEPYWLEGRTYWVWRYLMLSPAELNKFWERDWERVEIWIRADGPEAGRLEWVVLDAHYRELWIPYERLGSEERIVRQRTAALEHATTGRPGIWLVEVDASLIFHTPYIRTVSFLPEAEDIPVRSVWHLLSGLFKRGRRDDPDDYLPTLDLLRLRRGHGILDDIPEAIVPFAARHMLSIPWRYWRYPLGAQRRWNRRLYEQRRSQESPPAADPELQIKESV